MQERSLEDILDELLTEFEIFVNNADQLIKEAKKIQRAQKRSKKVREK